MSVISSCCNLLPKESWVMPLLGLAPFWVAVMLVAAASRFWEAIRAVLAETQELRERDCNCLTACFEGSHSYTALGSLC